MFQAENHDGHREVEADAGADFRGGFGAVRRSRLEGPGTIPYQLILSEFMIDPFSTNEKYDFEHVLAYVLQPEDDFETVIATHVKVALDPSFEYVISKPVTVRTLCYIIGNGAKLKIACDEPFCFEVFCRDSSPGIVGMWVVTFSNVVFERDRLKPGGVVRSRTFTLFHGCNFLGCMGLAVKLYAGGEVRGCHFFACYKCLDNDSKVKVKVKSCSIETSMVGVISRGKAVIKNCSGLNVYCFAYLKGSANMQYNGIMNSNGFYEAGLIEMVSCHGGIVLPLATIHVCSSASHPWPVMRHNVLTRCKLFLGHRRDTFSPLNLSLSYSSVVTDKDGFDSMNLNFTFHQTCTVWKLVRSVEPPAVGPGGVKRCLCGDLHAWPTLVQLDYTSRSRPNPYDSSCDSKVFSSDDDED